MSPNARAYYAADIAQFASSSVAAILGNLAANTDFDIELAQRNAWSEQIPILKTALSGIEGSIFLEFVVPRIGSRIDAVLVSGPVLFVIEFKVGAEAFSRDDLNQVLGLCSGPQELPPGEPRRGDCPDSGRDACESFGRCPLRALQRRSVSARHIQPRRPLASAR